MKIKNVLSLFNGMSCGNIALDRAGIEFDDYSTGDIECAVIDQSTQITAP